MSEFEKGSMFCNLRQRYSKWWTNKSFNPVTLKIRDKRLETQFMEELRERANDRSKALAVIIHLLFLIILVQELTDGGDHFWSLFMFSEIVVSVDVALLISWWKPAYIDFIVIQVQVTRAIATFFVFRMMQNETLGFHLYEPKIMQDSIYRIVLPMMLFFGHNWRVILFLSTPFMLISNFVSMNAADSITKSCSTDESSNEGDTSVMIDIQLFATFVGLFVLGLYSKQT